MKILVLSDSHYRKIDISFDFFDYVFHCGDYGKSLELLQNDKCIYVRGNCDSIGYKMDTIEISDKIFFITHGDLFNVKYDMNRLINKAIEEGCNYCLFGHTHYQEYFRKDNINFINPGSYQDGYYGIIDDNMLYFYYDGKIVKEYDLRG